MSSSTNSTKQTQKTLDFRQKYKTQKCRYWYERGFCPFNQLCAFAHTEEQLRGKIQFNQHYKTKICVNFKNNGCCKYGDRCQFLHLRQAPADYSRQNYQSFAQAQTLSEKLSVSSCDTDGNKHQNHLNFLVDYGLDMLFIKKGKRSERWRSFLIDGVDQYEVQSFKWEDFTVQFGDYDFRRKPRLGSM